MVLTANRGRDYSHPIATSPGQPTDRFRILCVDGGGIRGLIPALVIADLERRLREHAGDEARIADYFHMLAGTSTGGLIALALTLPDPAERGRRALSARELAALYTEDGPRIFRRTLLRRLATLNGWLGPKYSLAPLRDSVERRLGTTRLAETLRGVIVTSYDMTNRDPYFFKRWRAREAPEGIRNRPLTDAVLATSAAPTYFPSHELDGRALVDGGVFAANPVMAAVVEALKRRRDEPRDLSPDDLLVVSIGTGLHEEGYSHRQVRGWGKFGWIRPRDGEPPVLGAVLGGASDGADHWAHTLLNHPGDAHLDRDEIGRGPRFFRLQVPLETTIALDDASREALQVRLPAAAEQLIASHERELSEIVERLAGFDPLPFDPGVPAGAGRQMSRPPSSANFPGLASAPSQGAEAERLGLPGAVQHGLAAWGELPIAKETAHV